MPEEKKSTLLDVHSATISTGAKVIPPKNKEGLEIIEQTKVGNFMLKAVDISALGEGAAQMSCVGPMTIRIGNIEIEYSTKEQRENKDYEVK